MSNFLSEIIAESGCDFDTALGGVRYTVFEDTACYIEGHRGIVTFGTEEVLLKTKHGKLTVTGKNVAVRELAKGMLILTGEKLAVRYERAEKRA